MAHILFYLSSCDTIQHLNNIWVTFIEYDFIHCKHECSRQKIPEKYEALYVNVLYTVAIYTNFTFTDIYTFDYRVIYMYMYVIIYDTIA